VDIREFSGRAVELDFTQRGHGIVALVAARGWRHEPPLWRRSKNWVEDKRERANGQQRSNDERENHGRSSPFRTAARRASSSGVASMPVSATGASFGLSVFQRLRSVATTPAPTKTAAPGVNHARTFDFLGAISTRSPYVPTNASRISCALWPPSTSA